MSVFALPRDLPRCARLTLFAAFTIVGDDGYVPTSGQPPSALRTLMHLTGVDTMTSVARALRHLEQHGLVERQFVDRGRRKHQRMRVRLLLARLRVEGGCAECGSPASGTGRWCARCKQVMGRDDRSWQIRALELWGLGKTPPEIAVLVRRPLFEARNDDGREGSGGNAVVPFLVNHPDLSGWPEREAWAQRLRENGKGRGIDE